MPLSTRFSARRAFLRAAAAAALAGLAACASVPAPGGGGPIVDVSQPVPVALLVPLGAPDPTLQRIGQDLANAAQLARADLRDAAIDLRVYEDAGSYAGGQAAARRAIDEGAQIIVGPLLSTAAAGADSVARPAGVNMLTFSNNPAVAAPGVYLLGTTPLNAAAELVAFSRSRGLDAFGVLYVQGETAEEIRDYVIAAVNAGGGRVVSTLAYPYSQQGVADAAPAMAVSLQNAGANAVFLTERTTAGLVADGLRGSGLGPDGALFLGLQPWGADADTLARPSLQGAVFAAPDPGRLAAFQGRYAAAYGGYPDELAVLAYDGVAAVGALIAEARAGGGSPFSTARITQAQGFAGAAGAFRFTVDGLGQRSLAIVEVRGGAAAVVRRAAPGFDRFGL